MHKVSRYKIITKSGPATFITGPKVLHSLIHEEVLFGSVFFANEGCIVLESCWLLSRNHCLLQYSSCAHEINA